MTEANSGNIRWTRTAPELALPLRCLLLSHPAMVRQIASVVDRGASVKQVDAETITIDYGDRGYDLTPDGVEPWTRRGGTWDDEDGDGRRWLPNISDPWSAKSADGYFIWTTCTDLFDQLLRSGKLELCGRYGSFESPSAFIPPGGFQPSLWLSGEVDFRNGSFSLTSRETVYDVHIVRMDASDADASNGDDAGPWTLRQLVEWIQAGVRASPTPTFTKAGLKRRAAIIGLTSDQIDACWREAFYDVPADSPWKIAGARPNQSYPGIDS